MGYNSRMMGDVRLIYFLLALYAALVAVAFVLYIPKLIQFCYAFRKPPRLKATGKRRISVIVPARDESAAIGALFASLKKQDYDRDFFDVNVVVADEKDETVRLAKEEGANVFVVGEQRCKGDALDGYFSALGKETFEGYDAFVIVDADAILASDFLSQLNCALEDRAQIFVARKLEKNCLGKRANRSLFSHCSALSYALVDDLGNNYRSAKGISCTLCGQGLMLRREVIEQLGGWPYRTLTEDYELHLDCIVRGFTSKYYPHAVIYTEEPLGHAENFSRRIRWLVGVSQCDKQYGHAVRRKLMGEKHSFAARYDALFSLVPLVFYLVLTVLTSLLGATLTVFYLLRGSRLWAYALIYLTALPLAFTYAADLLYCMSAMTVYRDSYAGIPLGERLAVLFFAPVYMFEYFPIFIVGKMRVLLRKENAWKKVKRVEYDELPAERDRP